MAEFDPSKKWVELHLHLDGAVRTETLLEVARRRGLSLPADTVDDLVPHVSMNNPGHIDDMFHAFHTLIPVLSGDRAAIRRIAYELCEDQAQQGVVYFEARYCPHLLTSNLTGESGDDPTAAEVVELVNAGLQQGSKDYNIQARSLLCAIREHPEWSHEMVELCGKYSSDGVVGLDLAGGKVGYKEDANLPHIKAFQDAQRLGVHRTIHAGEVGGPEIVEEAVTEMHAERIGHGYHVLDDEDLYQRLKKEGMHFEVCPVSSYMTGAVQTDFKQHPAKRFAQDGANFSLSSDDPRVFLTSLTRERKFVKENWGFDDALISTLNLNAARACFLPEADKARLVSHIQMLQGP
ncbi:adenosine deaminase-like isoform X1 [Branchiostoma floridae x Branchiostoma belcheri]